MTVSGRLEVAVFDAPDIEKLASFYVDLAGWEIIRRDPDWITTQSPDGQQVAFQLAPDHLAPQWPGQQRGQQFHLDLQVEDHQAAAERAVGLGATRLADGPNWITLADPAGHPFDLCHVDGAGPAMPLFAVTIDAPDALALARFYAELLGMEVTYEGPEGALVAGGGKSLMFQQISDYGPPQWPNPEHPQQAHLDIDVDDLDAGEQRVLALGQRGCPAPANGSASMPTRLGTRSVSAWRRGAGSARASAGWAGPAGASGSRGSARCGAVRPVQGQGQRTSSGPPACTPGARPTVNARAWSPVPTREGRDECGHNQH